MPTVLRRAGRRRGKLRSEPPSVGIGPAPKADSIIVITSGLIARA
jgi:hypothetical protein